MKVSIITSCFNRERTIRETIESVLAQDYKNIEYIIIDGASTDKSLQIINEYSDKVSVILSEPDKGMYEAINKGIRTASGDIVGLLHSDDKFFSHTTISGIVRKYEQTGADLIYGNGLFVDSVKTGQIVRDWKSGTYAKDKIKRGWLPLHPTVYIKATCFNSVGLYNENYKIAADSDFLVRCLYKEHLSVSYLNEYIVCMRMGGASTSFRKTKQKWKEDIKIYRSHGFNPYIVVIQKILSKIPQFINARFKASLK